MEGAEDSGNLKVLSALHFLTEDGNEGSQNCVRTMGGLLIISAYISSKYFSDASDPS